MRGFDVAVYFKFRGRTEEEVDKLVYEFCQQFKTRHRSKLVPDSMTEKGSIVVEVNK